MLFTKKSKILLILFFFNLCFYKPVIAQSPTPINDINTFKTLAPFNSATNTYMLTNGSYIIGTALIDITTPAPSASLGFQSGANHIYIGRIDFLSPGTMFKADKIVRDASSDGSINVFGGNQNNTSSLVVNEYISSGNSSLYGYGGRQPYANGISVVDISASSSYFYGGSSSNTLGINSTGNATFSNMVANGGTGEFSYGAIFNNLTLNATPNNSGFIIKGGSQLRSHGVIINNNFTITKVQNNRPTTFTTSGGTGENTVGTYMNTQSPFSYDSIINFNAQGGAGNSSYGILANSFNFSGDTTLFSVGGAGDSSYGINSTGDFIATNEVFLNFIAGDGNNAHGLSTNIANIINSSQQTSILINGSSKSNASGISLTSTSSTAKHYIYSPVLNIIGGSGTNSHAVISQQADAGTLYLSSEGANIRGGTGQAANGIHFLSNLSMQNLTATFTGGSGNNAHGIYIKNFSPDSTQNSNITAIGGSSQAHGIFVNNSVSLPSSTYTATGGSNGSHGIQIMGGLNLNQLSLYVNGGTTTDSYGVYANSLTNNNSTISATAAQGDAIYVVGDFTNNLGGNSTFLGDIGHGLNVNGNLITNYAIMASNESTESGYGIKANKNFIQNGGSLVTAFGGSALETYGIYVGNDYQQNGGSLKSTGGSAKNAHGINVVNNFTQNSSSELIGGAGEEAHGLNIGQNYTQNNGDLTANGGTGLNSYGLLVNGNYELNGGTINSTAGQSGTGNHGIVIKSFTQNGLKASFSGNSASNSYGGMINGSYNQNILKASLSATGGSNNNSYGLYVAENLNQSGIVTASGGSALETYGIYVGGEYQQNGGSLKSTGGSAKNAHGINVVNNFTQNSSSELTGGAGEEAHGLNVGQSYTQNNGDLTANGGTGTNSYGLLVSGNYEAKNGNITAIAGQSGTGNHGIVIKSFTQNGLKASFSGNSASNSYGGMINGSYNQNILKASLSATGGSNNNSYGLYVAENLNQSGIVTASGGSALETYGIYVGGEYQQNGGSLKSTGGSGKNAHGINVVNNFTQNSSSELTGGAGEEAHGLNVGQSYTQNNGDLTAKGGTGTNSYGLLVNGNYEAKNGNITAIAGQSGTGNHGIVVKKSFNQNGLNASLSATGGSNNNSYGLYVAENLNQSGIVTASGGSALETYGIYVANDYQQTSGSLKSTGGSGKNAHGINVVNNFTQNSSSELTGGAGEEAHGLNVGQSYTQNNGDLTANGGTGTNSYGLLVSGNYEAKNGNITAIAGQSGTGNHGIVVKKSFNQNGLKASLKATGGLNDNDYGLYVAEKLNQSGIVIASGGSALETYGIYVANDYQQTSGSLKSTGGSGKNAHGINVVNNFTQNSSSELTGGAGEEAHGLNVGQNYTQNKGDLTANGGTGTNSYGLLVNGDYEAKNGNITAIAGQSGTGNHGIVVKKSFNQNGLKASFSGNSASNSYGGMINGSYNQNILNSSLSAIGGSNNNSYGLYVANNLNQSGIVLVSGGSALEAYGIYVGNDYQQTSGSLKSTGGSGKNAHGINVVNNFTQNSSSELIGGAGEEAHGLNVGQNYNHNNGDLTAKGGTGTNSYGLLVNGNYEAKNGNITAIAGQSGTGNHGIVIKSLTQNGLKASFSGNSASNSYGGMINGSYNQNILNSSLSAIGGSNNNSYGLYVANNLNQSGIVIASGGSALEAYGTYVGNDYQQTSGSLKSTGGSGKNAHGINVLNNFTQNSFSELIGGAGEEAHGLNVGQSYTQNNGDLTAKGGTGTNSYGLLVNGDYEAKSGNINAIAGQSGTDNHGIVVEKSFNQNGLKASFSGNSANNSYGGMIKDSYKQNKLNSFLSAIGGSSANSYGLYVLNTFYQSGNVTAFGGKDTTAHGLWATNYIQNSGNLTAQSDKGYGLYINNNLNQHGGLITTSAKEGSNASAIYIRGNYEQFAGTANVVSDRGHGIYIENNLNQYGGHIIANTRPTNNDKYAIYIEGGALFGGITTIKDNANFPDIYIKNTGSQVTFTQYSTLDVLINTVDSTSGLIFVENNDTIIEDGATVKAIPDALGLQKQESYFSVFLTSKDKPISGDFALDFDSTLNLDLIIEKTNNNHDYVLTVKRKNTVLDFFTEDLDENTRRLLEGLAVLYGDKLNGLDNTAVREALKIFDNVLTLEEFVKAAHILYKNVAPYEATLFALHHLKIMETGKNNIINQIDIASNDLNNSKLSFWATPFSTWGHFDAPTYEYLKIKDHFAGMSFGVINADYKNYAVSLSADIAKSNLKSDRSDTTAQAMALNLSARKYFQVLDYKPYVQITMDLSKEDYTHDRKVYQFMTSSSPVARGYGIDLAIGNDFNFKDGKISLTPEIGVAMNTIKFKEYTENGFSGLDLAIKPKDYNSVKARVGFKAKYKITEKSEIVASAFYKNEVNQKRAEVNSKFISTPVVKFMTKSPDFPASSASVNLGINHEIKEGVKLNLSYDGDFGSGRNYNSVQAGLKFSF